MVYTRWPAQIHNRYGQDSQAFQDSGGRVAARWQSVAQAKDSDPVHLVDPVESPRSDMTYRRSEQPLCPQVPKHSQAQVIYRLSTCQRSAHSLEPRCCRPRNARAVGLETRCVAGAIPGAFLGVPGNGAALVRAHRR